MVTISPREAHLRHAQHYIQIAAQAEQQYVSGGTRLISGLALFDRERPNLDMARTWAQRQAQTPAGGQLLLDLARATRYLGILRYDSRQESIPLWEAVRMAAHNLGNLFEEGRALGNLGNAYTHLGEPSKAIHYYEQALAIACELGDRHSEVAALANLGRTSTYLGNLSKAIGYHEQALAISRELGDHRSEGIALDGLGFAYSSLGESFKAITYHRQARSIARSIGDHRGESNILNNLGLAYSDLGNLRRAIAACEEALMIAREISDQRLEGYILSYLARAQMLQGGMARARASYTQAYTRLRAVGDRWGEAECQWLFGLALAQQGERAEALPLLRAAVAYEQEIGHAKAAEHAALVERLEVRDIVPPSRASA